MIVLTLVVLLVGSWAIGHYVSGFWGVVFSFIWGWVLGDNLFKSIRRVVSEAHTPVDKS